MNQKEVVKLAVMDNQMKNIEAKLDEHISSGKKDNDHIINSLEELKNMLVNKADNSRVDRIERKINYWAGALGIIIAIVSWVMLNIDKIVRGLK